MGDGGRGRGVLYSCNTAVQSNANTTIIFILNLNYLSHTHTERDTSLKQFSHITFK